jgi:hypothetical protein
MLLKDQFLKKQTLGAKYWLIRRVSCFTDFPNLAHSDRLPGVAYIGETKRIFEKNRGRSVIPLTGLEDVDYRKTEGKKYRDLTLSKT